ncbi:EpsG family protein [Oceanihabitans sediminis]|uniref:EpsG family protein n=1 Tax=Oceanihabitans sediminis TaxID=1812012 RepID=UPI003A8F4E6A
MIVYWFLLFIILIIQLIPVKAQKEYLTRLKFSLFFLFLYGAARVDFGNDYASYLNYFEGVKLYGIEFNERMELGFYYLNKLLPSFRSLLVVQTLLLCIAYYCLFKWYIPAKWAWLGFLLLFLNPQFNIFFMLVAMRNGIAVSIFIISTYFIFKKKLLPFAILIFIAFWFHTSVILYAPIAYLVGNLKPITKKSMIIWLSIMGVLVIGSNTFILDYIEVFTANYFDRYSTYVEMANEKDKGAGVLVSIFAFLTSGIILYYFKNKKISSEESMIVNFTLLFLLAFLLGALNMRLSQYFSPFFVVGSIILLYKRGERFLKHIYFAVIFMYLFYSLKLYVENPYFNFNTYHSIFM